MNTQVQQYYFRLGFNTQRKLNTVRGRKLSNVSWEEFQKLPEFQLVMRNRKVSNEELEAFEKGFKESIRQHEEANNKSVSLKRTG